MKSRNFKAALCIKITIALLLHNPEFTAPQKSFVPTYNVHCTVSHPTRLIFVIAAARTYIQTPTENCETKNTPRDFRLRTQCSWGLRSSGMLQGVTSQKSEGLNKVTLSVTKCAHSYSGNCV